MKENIIQPGGLHTDTSLVNQPTNTTRFVLNGVNETNEGDLSFISNEESNEPCISFKEGFIPIGKCYINNNETIIFLVSNDNLISEIGILKNNCNYETHVNDEDSTNKLGFTVENQIQATYRLRRGCERTVYWTDNNQKPRYFNFDKVKDFQDEFGYWDSPKFNLKKTIGVFPELQSVEILENIGQLPPGSYSVFLQYLDEGLNATKFVELISNINIINDSLIGNYADIQGSTGLDVEHIKYLATNKAIKIKFSLLDPNYKYFRLGFVQYTDGTGIVSKVLYSPEINTNTPEFIYTGANAETEGTIEEIELSNLDVSIDKVGSIEQIDNKLILANVSGPQYNFCALQKYVSKIKADVVLKDIILTNVNEEHNSKNPLVHYNGLSHQPGDIYSYGLIYIFEDLTESPVLHIPGKNNNLPHNYTFTTGTNIKGMRADKNKNLSEFYINKNNCGTSDYWGLDSEGQPLTNTNIRHHRFPTRDELGIGFVEEIVSTTEIEYQQLTLNLLGLIKKTVLCNPITDTSCPEYYIAPKFRLVVRYKKNGIDEEFTTPLITEGTSLTFFNSNLFLSTDVITNIELFYVEDGTITEINIPLDIDNTSSIQSNNLTYKITENTRIEETGVPVYQAPILGIKFSGITIPSVEEIGGKIIGYKIVRQERKDIDKNILDSAIILPMMTNNIGQGDFISASMNCPVLDGGNYPYLISDSTVNILSPQHKFLDNTLDGFTTIEEVGKYHAVSMNVGGHLIQDVYPGSSADGVPDISDNTSDNDGYSLKQLTRAVKVKYKKSNHNKFFVDNVDSDLYNLQPLGSSIHSNDTSIITNLSCDNKSLILAKKNNSNLATYNAQERKYPYVYVKKEGDFFYSNFETNPYYLFDNKIYTESECESFNGDTHIVPFRHSTHIFGNAIAARRLSEQSIWDWVIAAILVIVAVVVAIVTFGAATAASAALIMVAVGLIAVAAGSVVMAVAGYVSVVDFASAYQERWLKGLDFTLFDMWYQQFFYEPDLNKPRGQLWYRDDTFKWFGEVIGDFWFETNLNLSLRVPPSSKDQNYLYPLKSYTGPRDDKFSYLIQVTENDENLDGVSAYYHYRDDTLIFDGIEETYFARKILYLKDNKWSYLGVSTPIIFMLNNDHNIGKSVIKYYALSKEYDCCSDCQEKFPHRWHWSEQSFQEELTDNYRVFLPNNYKDITGETGEITNVFKINNDLFLHTSEALYLIPRSYQERVTDQIVTFIGTGSYGELPERKILDDDTGSSAGSQHKWGTIKTPAGVFFISENQRKIYQFNGQQLNPIINTGLSNWFQNNTKLLLNEQYYNSIGKVYPYNDNPSNIFGTGFISTYDTQKQRVIFTKKDYSFNSEIINNQDFEITICDGNMIYFPNYNQVIQDYQNNSWEYVGIHNCRMKFQRDILKTKTEIRTITKYKFADVDYLVFRYNFNDGNDLDTRTTLLQPLVQPPLGWCQNNPNTQYISWGQDNTGTGVESILLNIKQLKLDFPTNNLIEFNAKAWWFGNRDSGNVNMIAEGYKGGVMVHTGYNFLNSGGILTGTYSFGNINIPDGGNGSCNANPTNIGNFLYEIDLGRLSWNNNSGGEIPVETYTEEVEVQVNYTETEYEYVDGSIIENPINADNSWTISYSLNQNNWISWHSYLPNFYINVPEKFYSWIYGNDNLWKHNKLGHYQTFYDTHNPFIIEYVDTTQMLATKIWDGITLQTEAKKWNSDVEEYADQRFITFNKILLYNTNQISGILEMITKGNNQDYILEQIINTPGTIIINRDERDWAINELRDIRVDYDKPMFKKKLEELQGNYFIDKIVNEDVIDFNKDWTQMESFRDKFLVVRLIFDKFDDTRLLMNFSVQDVKQSER